MIKKVAGIKFNSKTGKIEPFYYGEEITVGTVEVYDGWGRHESTTHYKTTIKPPTKKVTTR